jgi:thiol-disulfide isomerase/thioredoxin
MKRSLLLLSLIGTLSFAQAQTSNYPNGSTVADFTVTDVDGVTHTLYDYTSQGKYVALDFFFVNCPPCQATTTYFNQLNETYGCNSHDLICLSVNRGIDNDAQVAGYEVSYGGPYHHCPAASNDGGAGTVNSTFGVSAWPTYCLIGPDNTMIANDMWPISSMSDFVAYFPTGGEIATAPCLAGITEQNSAQSLTIRPSPSQGQVTVEIAGMGQGAVTMEVLNMLGQQVRTVNLGFANGGTLQRTVDLSDLGDSQYLCRFTTPDGRRDIRRVVIAH